MCSTLRERVKQRNHNLCCHGAEAVERRDFPVEREGKVELVVGG
jgi:hypothetical protein